MMRILTAGESHGECMVTVVEGFPKGVRIDLSDIDRELRRRMSGFGRGKRMSLEDDRAEIASGLRNSITLGSPIAILVRNKEVKILPHEKDALAALHIPRPGHADLAGALKYQESDLRNILERASARETVSRVCAGSLCKQLLVNFDVHIASFTISVGRIVSVKKPTSISDIVRLTKDSQLNCIDSQKEKQMIAEIKKAERNSDSLGGIIEVWAEGLKAGLGTFMHFDKRLDAKLASYLMSIPAVKGVEVGLGFEYARKSGSSSHDAIYYDKKRGFYRKTNNSGGIEGGISTGEPIVARLAMKPIATLRKPLDSVHLITKKRAKAIVERSDTCAVVACAVIAEAMVAIALAEAFLEKFGQDTLRQMTDNYRHYLKKLL
jgi:chorismate synthase